jgi:hypothetical protein
MRKSSAISLYVMGTVLVGWGATLIALSRPRDNHLMLVGGALIILAGLVQVGMGLRRRG